MAKAHSVMIHKLKKELEILETKKGRGTELVTLYIPHSKQLSDVTSQMRDEYSQASNIKSARTRKNVQSALDVIMQRLKLIKSVPENGLALLVGTIPRGIKDKLEVYLIEPPEKITTYTYTDTDEWLDLIFYTDGTVIGIEDGYAAAGDWVKNEDTLIIDNYVFTISTLNTYNLTLQLSEHDTSTHYWNPMNDTIYFNEKTETIKWERETILPTNTNARKTEKDGKSFSLLINRK